MKKLLFVLPILLLALWITPWALYKDHVEFSSTSTGLAPSHWKLRAYSIGGSADLTRNLFLTDQTVGKSVPPISEGGRFYGFPFAFYVVNHGSSKASQVNIQAVSWLWLTVDALVVLGLLGGIAAFTARKQQDTTRAVTAG